MSDDFRANADALNALRRQKATAHDAFVLARDRAARGGQDGGADAARKRAAFEALNAREQGLLKVLGDTTDPRVATGLLSDAAPLLLLPVRIETRFKTLSEPARDAAHELWLRIYPDDCSVDGFEPFPSDAEIEATKLYWLNLWRAGGDEADKRAAWRGLVASCGVGRAGWLIGAYMPVNAADMPSKSPSNETLLVAGTEAAPAANVLAALQAYWPARWSAAGNATAQAQADDDLKTALGADGAADAVARLRPFNFKDDPIAPGTRASPPGRFVVVVFPDSATIDRQRFSWGCAPKSFVMPDRFVVLAYDQDPAPGASASVIALGSPVPSPLVVGLDPAATAGDQIDISGGDLKLGEDIAWLTDFEAAVAKGMGLRIPISPAQARTGFARIVVLGVHATAGATEGAALLQTLLTHHRDGRGGLALLPQGFATNNTEDRPADFKLTQDANAGYAAIFTAEGTPQATADWAQKQDGARLAAAFGLPVSTLQGVTGVNRADHIEARAMHTALWPGTLGYFLHEMIGPALPASMFDFARGFFLDKVSGRGPIPAIRIGAQPYGILPTSAYSRLAFGGGVNDDRAAGLARSPLDALTQALNAASRDWAQMAQSAPWVGRAGDPHRTLLDVLGQHPASVQFHRRLLESIEEAANSINLASAGITPDLYAALDRIMRGAEMTALFASLGWPGVTQAPIAERAFSDEAILLRGPVIDDQPLSENDPVRATTTDGRNYLRWLAETARADLDLVQRQAGFVNNTPPAALLYILLRFALLSGYRHEGTDRLLAAASITETVAAQYRRDPPFVHVKANAASESRYLQLYQADPTPPAGGAAMLLHQRIASDLRLKLLNGPLREQVDAIAALQDLPTARLERLFAEHLDCLSYRLDAWRTGLAFTRLQQMRANDDQQGAGTGILLGAYGWVERVRPKPQGQPASLPDDLAPVFDDTTDGPLTIDPINQGYIHAPSLNHAVTAAVLRNGHMSMADPAQGDELAVNLTSERTRRALDVMQGMVEGQSLAALLGYQFERGLHERYAPLELDRFIQTLRNLFPLDANRLAETAEPPPATGEPITARNVIDGRKLAATIGALAAGARTYPFGLTGLPTDATSDEATAIAAEADRLLDTLDAVSDVAISESVHQAVRGNFDRAAGMLDAFAKGGPPPEPEVTLTPRSSVALTHRIGLHLDPAAADPPPVATPRASGEPRLDAWLAQRLPPLSDIACSATYFDQTQNRISDPVRVSVADLGLSALDLVSMSANDPQRGLGALDDLVLNRLCQTHTVCPDGAAVIDYSTRPAAGDATLFELAPLLASLRSVITASRPLRASDLAPPSAPYPDPSPRLDLSRPRIASCVAPLQAQAAATAMIAVDATTLASGPRAALIAALDDLAARLQAASVQAVLYGISSSGFTVVQDNTRQVFAAVRSKAANTADQWASKLSDADTLLANDLALAGSPDTTDDERRKLLRAAEALVSTDIALTDPVPSPAALRTAVIAKRDAFETKRTAFSALAGTAATRIDALVAAERATAPTAAFTHQAISFEDEELSLTRFCEDIARAATALAKETGARADKAAAALTIYDAAASDIDRAQALDDAAKALFGPDYFIVPGVRLSTAPRSDTSPDTQAGDWAAAIAGAGPAGLLKYLTADLDRLDPVDEWFAAAARVRAPIKQLERIAILSEGFGAAPMRLEAFQTPYKSGDAWLGADFPPGQDLAAARLLYTAHLGAPWDTTQFVYGLLADEWVEGLPNETETTGLAFNFNRPNAEPPQAMLLVVPPQLTGAWKWNDIVDAVNETLDIAKQRAVEPAEIDQSEYTRLLPATVFAMAQKETTIVADLALNNHLIAAKLVKQP